MKAMLVCAFKSPIQEGSLADCQNQVFISTYRVSSGLFACVTFNPWPSLTGEDPVCRRRSMKATHNEAQV